MTDQQKLAIGVVVALVFAVGLAVFFTRDGGSPDRVVTADGSTTTASTTTTVAEATTSTTFQPGAPTVIAAPDTTTTTATTTTTSAPVTTTVAVDERHCAEINALTAKGLSGELCQEGTPVAGEKTTLHLTARDGDAQVRNDCGSPDFEWGDEPSVVCAIGCSPSNKPHEPSQIDVSRDHVYASPGTYDAKVTVESSCGEGPFGERQTFELQIEIRGD